MRLLPSARPGDHRGRDHRHLDDLDEPVRGGDDPATASHVVHSCREPGSGRATHVCRRPGELSFALLTDESEIKPGPGTSSEDLFRSEHMPTIVESNPANADLSASVSGSSSRVVPNLEQLKESLNDDPNEYAIVLGPGVDLEAAAAFADTLPVTRPATSVILIRRRVDASVLAEPIVVACARSSRSKTSPDSEKRCAGGSRDRAGPQRSCERLLGAAPGRLITVFSPKGGIDKTTLAVNLAMALSSDERKTCLVDLDLAFGDIAITLQLFPCAHDRRRRPHGARPRLPGTRDAAHAAPQRAHALVAPVQPDAKDLSPPR